MNIMAYCDIFYSEIYARLGKEAQRRVGLNRFQGTTLLQSKKQKMSNAVKKEKKKQLCHMTHFSAHG